MNIHIIYFHGEISKIRKLMMQKKKKKKKKIIWSCVHCLLTVINTLTLTLIMLWADSVEDKLAISCPRKRIWHGMQIISYLRKQFAWKGRRYPAAPNLEPHCPPRSICPTRTDACHAMHTLQHNQDLHCSEYRFIWNQVLQLQNNQFYGNNMFSTIYGP